MVQPVSLLLLFNAPSVLLGMVLFASQLMPNARLAPIGTVQLVCQPHQSNALLELTGMAQLAFQLQLFNVQLVPIGTELPV